MSENRSVDETLRAHREALDSYHRWDQEVKHLLKGRRQKDLNQEDMEAYREAAEQRDAAYNRMRELERTLLDSIPGASTGVYPRIDLDTDPDNSP